MGWLYALLGVYCIALLIIQKSVGDAGKLLRKNRRGKIGKNGSGEKHWLFR